ncbi:MAG: 50S ribosomal protein L11 [Candidatus Altiarchaeota archaeon]|nr:50S ribosomal protein L11 [Candidatus Altiarchaeota archaeon]
MAKETVESLVDAGNASAGPPLGPALGPTGVNIGKVVAEINEKTAPFKGMKVPIKVIVDTDNKDFEIKIGSPPASSLLKKEAGIETGAKDKNSAGDITFDQLLKVAKMKKDSLLAGDMKSAIKEVAGTCLSTGITIEGMRAKDFMAQVNEGKFDDRLKEE